jgi:hypothetical protein
VISKISKGNGFRGAAEYLLGKEGAQQIGGNMSVQTPRDLAAEFGAVRDTNQACKQPVFHASLSAAPGERLTDEQWQGVAKDYLRGMGFDPEKHQWTTVRHTDRDHDHIHILANRIDPEGPHRAVSSRFDHKLTQDVCRQVEAKHGLTPGHTGRQQQVSSRLEGGRADSMRAAVDKGIAHAGGSREGFGKAMHAQGIDVRYNQQSTGRVAGVSFQPANGGSAIKGSQLGKGYSWGSIEARIAGKTLSKSAENGAPRAVPKNLKQAKQMAKRAIVKAIASGLGIGGGGFKPRGIGKSVAKASIGNKAQRKVRENEL